MSYDPGKRVDPAWWNSLGSDERVHIAEAAHVVPGAWHFPIRDSRAHAIMHVVVENLVAQGDETPIYATLQKLARQGLERHDAIHALSTVFAEHARTIGGGRADSDTPPPEAQVKRAAAMTASSWRGQGTQTVGNRADRRSATKGFRRVGKAGRKKKKKRKK